MTYYKTYKEFVAESVNEAINIKKETRDIEDHFGFMDAEITDKFDLKKFAKHFGWSIEVALVALYNLEDEDTMNDIGMGDYPSSLDREDYNDDYGSLVDEYPELNESDDEDEEAWFYPIADAGLEILRKQDRKYKKYSLSGLGPGDNKTYMQMEIEIDGRYGAERYKVYFDKKDKATKVEEI